jgi:SPP1 gp7 family putative phage head morphogenesis protein
MPDYEQLRLDFEAEMRRVLLRYVPAAMQQAYQDVNDSLSLELAFDLRNPRVRELIETQVFTTAQTTSETLIDVMRTLFQQSVDEGWSVDTLAAALREKATDWSTSKAETVAHTELATAYERGNHQAWRDSGVVDRKEWILSFNACPQCQEYGGKIIGLEDEFADGILHPPAHTRCRCATVAVLKDR